MKFTQSQNVGKCVLIAGRFQQNYDNGSLRTIRSAKLGNESVICALRSGSDSCTEKTVLFAVPPGQDPNTIMRRLLDSNGLAAGNLVEL
ncbi:COP23 domain-containing protein [Merismopedia glauca]|uniref:COP23 domain-containing protein n=1 Tax=Merismopedia glauca TaxID=292586 RepID=UPI0034E0C141